MYFNLFQRERENYILSLTLASHFCHIVTLNHLWLGSIWLILSLFIKI
nr:MAG TPA: hypothetical protein [Caudoviricetes sp.]